MKLDKIPNKSILAFIALAVGVAVSFQNCGSGSFYVHSQFEDIDFSSLSILSANYSFIFDPKASGSVTADQYGRVEAIHSVGGISASLHPVFSGASSGLNLEATPTVEGNSLRFTPAQHLELSRYDLNRTYSGEYTLGIVLSQMQFQAADNMVIRILDLYPPEGTEYNGHIFLQLEKYLDGTTTKYRFSSGIWYSGQQHAIKYFNIPTDQITRSYFIMLVVPPDASGFRLIVNGAEHLGEQQGPTALSGSMPPLPRNVRSLQINGYSKGSFFLHSIFMALQGLSQNDVIQTYRGIAQREGISLSGTGIGSGGGSGGGSTVTYGALTSSGSRAVFANSCIGCHSAGSPQGGLNLQDYNQAVAKIGSIISRMEGGGSIMPPSGKLPQSQIDLVKQWQAAGTPR